MEDLVSALLVENSRSAAMIRGALSEAGCGEIWSVQTIEEALARPPHSAALIVIAVPVPARTDLRRLSRHHRGAPVVVIAADDAIEAAFEAGASDCVSIPVRRAELVARVHAAMRVRQERTRRSSRERKLGQEIRRLERENSDLERTVCVDSLTGLANRRHLLTLLGSEWKRSVRDNTPLSAVMIDLDFFHAFNERYGHPGGDDCLRRATEAMVSCLRRPSDFLGRYGGEEFLAVLPNTDAAGARLVADRLCAVVAALGIPHQTSECSPVVTISAGFACDAASGNRTVDALVAAADAALLRAKSNGRNQASGEAPAPAPPDTITSSYPWTRFPAVVADPWLVDRVPQFLAETADEARHIDQAMAADDFDRIRIISRRLRAKATDYGFEQVRQLASLIEHCARIEDHGAIRESIEELEQYVTHVQVSYRRPLEKAC